MTLPLDTSRQTLHLRLRLTLQGSGGTALKESITRKHAFICCDMWQTCHLEECHLRGMLKDNSFTTWKYFKLKGLFQPLGVISDQSTSHFPGSCCKLESTYFLCILSTLHHGQYMLGRTAAMSHCPLTMCCVLGMEHPCVFPKSWKNNNSFSKLERQEPGKASKYQHHGGEGTKEAWQGQLPLVWLSCPAADESG